MSKKVAVLMADYVEEIEYTSPKEAIEAKGYEVEVISPDGKEVNGKNGKMLVCQDRECGHRKNIARTTNARCPKCKKKMTLSGEGDGQMFTCVCGHREKMASFKARRDKAQKGRIDKRTVNKYTGKKDENINSALADQLKGLKF